jgi:arginine exporter protein ArgO
MNRMLKRDLIRITKMETYEEADEALRKLKDIYIEAEKTVGLSEEHRIAACRLIDHYIEDHQNMILLVGGVVLVLVGISMAFSNPFRNKKRKKRDMTASPKDFGQAVAMAFSNPGAIFIMFTLFAFFGLAKTSPQSWKVAPIILSVSAGSVTYWFCMSWLISRFSNRISMKTVVWINRIAGALVVIVGVALFGQGLVNVVFYGKPIL